MSREDRILAECKRRGLTVERTGRAWRITGHGVDIHVLHLSDVDLAELNPHNAGRSSARAK